MFGTEPSRSKHLATLEALPVGVVAAGLIGYRLYAQVRVGMGWDSYAFLTNAAAFAGRSVGYVEPHRPPVMSALTAVLFRLGAFQASALQFVDAALVLLGVAAFFLLLRRRFGFLPSAAGALSLLAVEPLWELIGTGYSDTPAVGFSVLAMVLLFKATEEDERWYLLALPMLTVAVLTRYGALIMAFPVVSWLVMRSRPIRQAKRLVQGVALAVLAYLPAGVYFQETSGDFFAPLAGAIGTTAASSASAAAGGGIAGIRGLLSAFVGQLHSLLAPGGMWWATLAMLLLAFIGLLMSLVDYAGFRRPSNRSLKLAAASAVMAVVGQLVGGTVLRQVTLLLAVLVIARTLMPKETMGPLTLTAMPQAMDLVMAHWGLAYLDAHGHLGVFVPRYFITMAPAAVYFVLLGWKALADKAAERWEAASRDKRAPLPRGGRVARPVIWSAYAAVVVVALVLSVRSVDPWARPDPLVEGARKTAEWLRQHDDSETTVVYSDLWPLTSWYLGREARPMPTFKDRRAFQHELDKYSVDWFVTIRGRQYESYDKVYSWRGVSLLKRETSLADGRPRIQYLGNAWQNYLESLVSYSVDLIHPSSLYGRSESMYMDVYTADELAKYDAVAVYGVRWRDRARAEEALREYVERGGTAVIDASGNLGDISYPLDNTILLDTIVRRDSVGAEPEGWLSPAFEKEHGLSGWRPRGYVNESGAPWYGARYEPMGGRDRDVVLATLDGKPAIVLQRLGKGRVYWMGFNLAWHAYLTGDEQEAALVRAVLEEAVDDARKGRQAKARDAVTGDTR